jgi:hypothetical protein
LKVREGWKRSVIIEQRRRRWHPHGRNTMERGAVCTVNSKVSGCAFAMLLMFCGASQASAQECPSASPAGADTASQTQTLQGRLIYHDGIRQWFELKLDRAQCGKSSVQLTMSDRSWKPLQIARGCRVATIGKIDFSPTGYYSLDLYQDAIKVSPIGVCLIKSPFEDESSALPAHHIHDYRVEMDVDYRPGDHPIVFQVRSGNKVLHPWQAYASYMLTGSFVLYGLCGHGFVVDKVYGTPVARPSHFDEPLDSGDMAAFDPESAAQAGKTDLHLGYSCVRAHSA